MNDFERAKRVAVFYRSIGLCPLPSRMDVKAPMLKTYADHYGDVPVPESVYERWATTNIQVLCGTKTPTPTKLIIVDLDGPEAREVWLKISAHHNYKRGRDWNVRTGGGGVHLYFQAPPGLDSCPSGMLWGLWDTWGKDGKGKWEKHKEIRILADNSIAIAPPSLHVDPPHQRYEFINFKPSILNLPPVAPDWLLAMPRLASPRCTPEPEKKPYSPWKPIGSFNGYTRDEVLEAIGDRKMDVAADWGVKFAVRGPNAKGWVSCYVPGREIPGESSPSGSFHCRDGTLQDRKDGTTISFFDIGVLTGHFSEWRDAREFLGQRFLGVKPSKSAF